MQKDSTKNAALVAIEIFFVLKRRRKRFNFNSSRHRQYNESFQTCS